MKLPGLFASALVASALLLPAAARAYVVFDNSALLQAGLLQPKSDQRKGIGALDPKSGFIPPNDIGTNLTILGSSDGKTFATKDAAAMADMILGLMKDNKDLATIEIIATNVHENHDSAGLAGFRQDLAKRLKSKAPKAKIAVKGLSTKGQLAWSAMFIGTNSFCVVTAKDKVALTTFFDKYRYRGNGNFVVNDYNDWCQASGFLTGPAAGLEAARISGANPNLSSYLNLVQ